MDTLILTSFVTVLMRCRRGAWLLVSAIVLGRATFTMGQTVAYEGVDWPEDLAWSRDVHCDPDRAIIDGWFEQEVARCPDHDPPGGQQERFIRSLADFVGSETFFLEWRMETTGPASEIVGVAPASVVIAGSFGTNYHFTIARDQVRLIRDNLLPIVFVTIGADKPHTYRLELRGAESYAWYIDVGVADAGIPEGPFPINDSPVVSFRAKSWFEPSTTRWDYIRFGVIPRDGSGDYDSDGTATLFDHYFVRECMTNGGPDVDGGPGCRFTDFDGDTDADLLDFAAFQNLFDGP